MNPVLAQVVLHTADYIVMAVYMLALIAMGLYFRKFAQQGIENYFLAGRKMPGWLTGVSYAATCMNAARRASDSGKVRR